MIFLVETVHGICLLMVNVIILVVVLFRADHFYTQTYLLFYSYISKQNESSSYLYRIVPS